MEDDLRSLGLEDVPDEVKHDVEFHFVHRVDEVLAIVLAPPERADSQSGRPAPQGVVAMGEIGLAGELRRVRDLPQRISEAARLGFRVAVVPEEPTRRGGPNGSSEIIDGMRVLSVPDIGSALRLLRLTRSEPERQTS